MAMAGTYDVVIRGGAVYDGSGAPARVADVGVRGVRIVEVGTLAGRGVMDLDARGLVVAPGFIDVHSHDDFAVLLDPEDAVQGDAGGDHRHRRQLRLGVVPFEAGLARFRRFHPAANPEPWDGFAGYLARVDEARPSLNVAVLMGHGSLRRGAMGLAQRAPSAAEFDRMRTWVREGVAAGAMGLSTGLIYEPGCYAATEEIVGLARELGGPSGGLYATHMRNEADGLLDAIGEAIRVGEEAGVPVEISHHKVAGRRNWGRVGQSLRMMEDARGRGMDVTADQYTAGSTSLAAVVQSGALRGNRSGGLGELTAGDVLIASAPEHAEWEGSRLSVLADSWGLSAEAACERILAGEGEACFVVIFTMDEADVRLVMAHPTTMIGSDGVPCSTGKPHPRL
jgi:N-acyl-D-amino-acid deacylase